VGQHAAYGTLDPPVDLAAAIRDFLRLGERLNMPDTELQAIIGMNATTWAELRAGQRQPGELVSASHIRRLQYALRLMRRSSAGMAMRL
jgi:hypothetical protein